MPEMMIGMTRADAVAVAAGTTIFDPLPSGLDGITTESQTQWTIRTPGTFSRLQVQCDANGTGRTVTLRKNTANATLTVSLPDTTATTVTDSTHTDHFAAGDKVDLAITQAAGTNTTIYIATLVFLADSGLHVGLYGSNCGPPLTTTTGFFMVMGRGVFSTTEANQQNKMRVAGTLSNLNLFVYSSTANNTTVVSRINGVTGTITITVNAGTTGSFEDSTHSDAFIAGDLLNFQCSGQAVTGFNALSGCAITYTSVQNDIASARSAASIAFSASNRFIPVAGNLTVPNTTESLTVMTHGFGGTCKNLRAYVSVNTLGSTLTIALRKNSATVSQNLPITATTTGWFEDTTNSDTFSSGDTVDYLISGGTSGAFTPQVIMMTEVPNFDTYSAPIFRMQRPAWR